MQGQLEASAHRGGRGGGAEGLRLAINPGQLHLDDRTVIFKFTGDGGWFCASFGKGAKYMRAADEDPALRRRIEARAERLMYRRDALSPDLARVMAAVELAKDYDPDELRDEQGRWTGGGAAGATAELVADAARMFGSSSYVEGLKQIAARALAAVRALPAAVGDAASAAGLPAAAFFGTLFFPTPRNLVASDGTLPDASDYSYHFDQEAGHLTITHQLADGTSETVFDGRYDKDGVFRDDQGNAIGRFLGDSVALDADAVRGYEARRANSTAGSGAAVTTQSATDTSDPEVCPDPSPDKGGGKKAGAIAYQMFVGMTINGEPLPAGLAIKMMRPSGKPVYFDDCQQSDGSLIEAKGLGYSDAMNSGKLFPWLGMYNDMMDQASRQLEAANGRPITWYFAEQDVADTMRAVFAKKRPGISVIYLPPPKGLIGELERILRGAIA